MTQLRGWSALLHESAQALTGLVERTHRSVARRPIALLSAVPGVGVGAQAVGAIHDGIAGAVYGGIRLLQQGLAAGSNAAATAAEQTGLSEALAGSVAQALDRKTAENLTVLRDTVQGAINGWVGDFLADKANPLAFELGFCVDGKPLPCTPVAMALAYPAPSRKVCVFIHGLGCTDLSWRFDARAQFGDDAANYGQFLARDLGFTSLFVRYNTGLHIAENARALCRLLETLQAAYPVEIDELVLVGHSMGGLVARGAVHYAVSQGCTFQERLTHLLCIGSPHLGAPLEKATHWLATALSSVDAATTQIPAALLNTRSAGIKDLRFGKVVDEDASLPPPMLPRVTYGTIAATVTSDPEHPLGRLLGDLLVRVPSATGVADVPERHVRFDLGEVVHGVHHLAMLNHPRVYAQVLKFLSTRVIAAEGAVAAVHAALPNHAP
jgi:pimeloyl-ACP methyl ester carboxylesterase